MFEQLFTASPEVDRGSTTIRRLRKGVTVGPALVGMACAYSMLIKSALDETVIVDVNRERLEGEVMDLVQGLPFVQPSVVRSGTLADGEDADIAIVTAGAKQRPGESRLDLVQRYLELFKGLISDVVKWERGVIRDKPGSGFGYVGLRVRSSIGLIRDYLRSSSRIIPIANNY